MQEATFLVGALRVAEVPRVAEPACAAKRHACSFVLAKEIPRAEQARGTILDNQLVCYFTGKKRCTRSPANTSPV